MKRYRSMKFCFRKIQIIFDILVFYFRIYIFQDAVESACKAVLPRGLSPTENDVRFAVCIGWINLSLSNGMF
jgi:hypothetical protein